ncbi:hypothetical protein [Skermania piniformis]|uniref:Uncharacterized protein n=1 Tax=Skermania pinensis TaxID=39122 RepID=A0ABX8SBB2_9ACTN|nr:hypothetical protein [Skermania piniformis]QXQ13006.1 hypothetical protein KV203_13955 [Skermania piniformis]
MGTTVSKSVCRVVFAVGLVGAAVGIAALHAQLAVFWLIVASTSGLILLKMRAEEQERRSAAIDRPQPIGVVAGVR